MLSVLQRQTLMLKAAFTERYPHAWLVWEPGPWKPARSVLESNLEATIQPSQAPTEGQAPGDAICFELKPPASGAALKVGRATTNDVVINDLTASREQFSMQHGQTGWVVAAPQGLLTLDGASVEAPAGPLRSGASLALGGVRLTFLSTADLARRAAAYVAPR